MKKIDDLGFEKKEQPEQNRLSDEEAWLRIFVSFTHEYYIEEAYKKADIALIEFRKRFPK